MDPTPTEPIDENPEICKKYKEFREKIASVHPSPCIVFPLQIMILDEHGADAATESYKSVWEYIAGGFEIDEEGIFFIASRHVQLLELPMSKFSLNTYLIMMFRRDNQSYGIQLFTGYLKKEDTAPSIHPKGQTCEILGKMYPNYCPQYEKAVIDVIYTYQKRGTEMILASVCFFIPKNIYNASVRAANLRFELEHSPVRTIIPSLLDRREDEKEEEDSQKIYERQKKLEARAKVDEEKEKTDKSEEKKGG